MHHTGQQYKFQHIIFLSGSCQKKECLTLNFLNDLLQEEPLTIMELFHLCEASPFICFPCLCNNFKVAVSPDVSLVLFSFSQMVGVEYILLHAQEPILFIIRKQQRQSPTQGEDIHSIIIKGGNHKCCRHGPSCTGAVFIGFNKEPPLQCMSLE